MVDFDGLQHRRSEGNSIFSSLGHGEVRTDPLKGFGNEDNKFLGSGVSGKD